MDKSFFLNLIIAFIIFLIGLIFLQGIWQKKGKIIKTFLNIDYLFFPDLKDRRILQTANQLAFMVCLLMALLTLLNGLLFLFSQSIPNVSAIFLFIAVILSWPIRIVFILIYKERDFNEVPRIWPFPKLGGHLNI